MTPSPVVPPSPGPPPDAVAARLRAAGCVFAEEEAALLLVAAGAEAGALDALVARRVSGEPLEQILGWAEFAGLRIAVVPGVFVPRRRTELLARLALSFLDGESPADPAIVVDLCCGAGAVGAAVLAGRPDAVLYAADVEPVAVDCARRNLPTARAVLRGDLFGPLPAGLRGRVRVITANAPYVPTEAIAMMPPEARDHEPLSALDGGPDGLDLHRRIVAAAPAWLAPGGRLLIEAGEHQAPVTARAMADAGLAAGIRRDDDLDAWAVVGVRPG